MDSEQKPNPRFAILSDLDAIIREPSEAAHWRHSLVDLLSWAYGSIRQLAGNDVQDSLSDDLYALEVLITAISTRTTHNMMGSIVDQDVAHSFAAEGLAKFYTGDLPPGPKALESLFWFYPKDVAERLAAMPYDEFLRTPYWKCVRAMAMDRDGHRCRMCNATGPIQVHHRTYEHRGREHEHLDDLTTLCAGCHRRHHEKGGASR